MAARECAAHRSRFAWTRRQQLESRRRETTAFGGGVDLTLRAEAFNLFNRVQFGPPNTQVTTAANSTFGQVTTQANQPRLMQLAFRLTF